MRKLSEKRIKCPECGGPGKIVHETAEYVAIQCLKGHWRSQKKFGQWKHQKVYPVVLVSKEH